MKSEHLEMKQQLWSVAQVLGPLASIAFRLAAFHVAKNCLSQTPLLLGNWMPLRGKRCGRELEGRREVEATLPVVWRLLGGIWQM